MCHVDHPSGRWRAQLASPDRPLEVALLREEGRVVLKRRHARQSPLHVGLEGWRNRLELREVHLGEASAFARHGRLGATPVGLLHDAKQKGVAVNEVGLQADRPQHPVEIARDPCIAHFVGRHELAKTKHVGLAHANLPIHRTQQGFCGLRKQPAAVMPAAPLRFYFRAGTSRSRRPD